MKVSYLYGMSEKSGTDTILETFQGISRDEWLAKVQVDLRGKSVEDMDWQFDDDLQIEPFVHSEDLEGHFSRIAFNPNWEIAEEFDVTDEANANAEILDALSGGCEVIMLKLSHVPEWKVLFAGIDLRLIKTYLIPSDQEKIQGIISTLEPFLEGLPSSENVTIIHVRSGKNLIGGPAHTQTDKTTIDTIVKTVLDGIRLIEGGNDDDVIECVVEIGDTYFVEIARIRALRILWANVLMALELNEPRLFIEARFSDRDMTNDVHHNMIAAGSKALSAICGGVDRLIIAPSHADADSFHRRISRNIHHILRYESKLDVIEDPVKGSYYLENLTKQIVEKAWVRIQKESE